MRRDREHLFVARDPDELFVAAAGKVIQVARDAVETRGVCSIALSGGSTPQGLYRLLSSPQYSQRIEWSRVHLFWSDERYVPLDDPRSNYGMAARALLSKISLPETNVHPVATDLRDVESAASRYESSIRSFFGPTKDSPPRFDLILLGLGQDGHTASLFPSSSVLRETRRLVVGYHVEVVGADRITFTLPLLNKALRVLFLVSGSAKSQILYDVLEGPAKKDRLPAQLVQPNDGTLFWFVDESAAARLSIRERAE